MWENAVEVCKELAKQYEEHDFHQLSALLRRMADFYDKIMVRLRAWPGYFRVAYYGRGFPPFLQNKVLFFLLIEVICMYFPIFGVLILFVIVITDFYFYVGVHISW